MERDIRRDRGQWRGCHSFKDIICDGDDGSSPRRDGGLKMGQTYYYYYELDGSTETHDPTLPTTNYCPYLPGQTVNTLWVPVEQSLRKRSASLNSMRAGDLRTMNPDDKFTTPRPAGPPLANMSVRHATTAPSSVRHKRSARSLSPGSNWSFSPRKLFSRKASSSSLRESEDKSPYETAHKTSSEDIRSVRESYRHGSRSRDISPESLRRFLSGDSPVVPDPDLTERPSLVIPEDIVEENEDDDNFATSATSDAMNFTILSPPPSQHAPSRCPTPVLCSEVASQTQATKPEGAQASRPEPPTRSPPRIPESAQVELPARRTDTFFDDSDLLMPTSPESIASNDIPSFYYSDDDDEDEEDEYQLPSLDMGLGDTNSFHGDFGTTLSTYSLPLTSDTVEKLAVDEPSTTQLGSPALVARNGTDVPVGDTSLLAGPNPNSGLDELVNELGWIADIINCKRA